MNKLEAMSMLVEVVDKGSFSAVSRALHIPLTTISRKISDLEDHLGTRLLKRTTRKLVLTDSGASYISAARNIIEQVKQAEREAAGEYISPTGELIITAPIMFGRMFVLPVITEFLATFPEISVRLLLADRNMDIIEDNVDMAVRIGNLPDSTMVATQVGTMRTVTCGRPDLFARHGIPQTPTELKKTPCITVDTPMPATGWQYESTETNIAKTISVPSRLSVTTPEAAAQAAILGVGVARLLHYQVANAIASEDLQVVLKAFEPAPSPIHLLHASRGLMPLKLRRFLDFSAPRLKNKLENMR